MRYVLITAAFNEERFLEETIKAVASQTVQPQCWYIVSDGSTDATDEIILRYTALYPWIRFLRLPPHSNRSFSSKVRSIRKGYQHLQNLSFDYIGILDADITFDRDYFDFLISRMYSDHQLGIAGTSFTEGEFFRSDKDSFMHEQDPIGPCQFFRRKCFENIGGYSEIEAGVDLEVVIKARMHGWKTHCYQEHPFHHNRVAGTASHSHLQAKFQYGRKDYFLGCHPLWFSLRVCYQMTKKPYIVGGLALLTGFIVELLTRHKYQASEEFVRFRRKEQLRRLGSLWHKFFLYTSFYHVFNKIASLFH